MNQLKYFRGKKYNLEKKEPHAGVNQYTKEVGVNSAHTKDRLAEYTQEMIGEIVGLTKVQIGDIVKKNAIAENLTKPLLYNIWNLSKQDPTPTAQSSTFMASSIGSDAQIR